jgi:sulfur-oxidizing protein SoxZ
MNNDIRVQAQLRDGVVHARVLMPHPMETGLRTDPATGLVPAHHIDRVEARVGARTVFAARLGIAVSRDPVVLFRFRGARAGERLRVAWTDSRGDTRSAEVPIA